MEWNVYLQKQIIVEEWEKLGMLHKMYGWNYSIQKIYVFLFS